MPWQEFQNGMAINSEKLQIESALLDLENSSHFLHLLSEDEKDRAFRLKDRTASNRQIISRGILRLLLGKYTSLLPE
jgi:hypothetical protein